MTSTEAPGTRSPLSKILQVMFGLGVFLGLGVLTLRGLNLVDLILPLVALGLPVYLILLVDPILAIAIMIACIGLSPELTIAGISNLRLEDFVMPGIVMGWVLRAGRERAPMARAHVWAPAVLSMLAMLCSTLAGTPFRTAPLSQSFLVMGKYAEYLMMYIVIINTVKSEGEVRALAIFSILVAIASSWFSLSSTIGYSGELTEGRVLGPMGETSNIYGGYLALNLLVALGLFLHSATEGGRLIHGAAVVLLGISILFTYSRTTYVAIGGAILIYGSVKHRRLLLILLVLAIVLPLLAPQSVMDRMATVTGVATGPSPSSWASRLEAWEIAWNRTAASDLLFGLGIYSVQFADVDSEYMRILMDTGIAGLILFGWVLQRFGRLAYRTHDTLAEFTFYKGYFAGYLMLFIALMIHGVAATSFSAIRTEETFMVFTGLMTVLANARETQTSADATRPVVLLENVPILEPRRY